MTVTSPPATPQLPPGADPGKRRGLVSRMLEALLTQRVVLLAVLIILVLVGMTLLDVAGLLSGSYNADYLASALISAVPLAMLGLAQLMVILSGKGGIDLSVGSMVSITGVLFGLAYGSWGWGFLAAFGFAVLAGAACGAINGALVAYIGFPPLIATLATYYAFRSLALVISDQKPVNSPEIQAFYSAAQSIEIPLIGGTLPLVPLGIFTFLLPTVVVVWLVLNKTTFGRRLYAIGTNDVAAAWSGINVRPNRMVVYVLSGVISALVAVVTVAQFASARPDAGTSGNGMALPAITIAVLGGVAITGGIGRVAGIVLSTLLIVWLNAGILLAFPGNDGSQYQLLALGLVLIFASLLNGITKRRYGGI
ncbi:monosaccharide ABC transporter membrane protein (CUT2 family) [Glaciihabitans tibetensis]|uniref:Monosaccharide ABC transporter membrane protein (CUT2 family) n=1 Tax=Glaciihabitans tibetensis TaxID=1266600 RepID=A0A2T0V1L0_9MICO|nr:ABC transporter permease [Glaciihabitans tibetensis]PRY64062.1 monosaccharide ABC transporter membrane protein (CUT2 family) [Glaciihabitans tibetensis]